MTGVAVSRRQRRPGVCPECGDLLLVGSVTGFWCPTCEARFADPAARTSRPPKKWGEGRQLDLIEFTNLAPERMLWWKNRPVQKAVILNMSFAVVWRAIQNGRLRMASVRSEYTEWLRTELLFGELDR